jgi:alpha-D-xyloside xylohydrolase
MLGPDLLVAPIYNEVGRRSVYLPTGRWIDFWTRAVLEGPRHIQVEVPLDILPLYVRENALIPTIEPIASLKETPFDPVIVDAYLFQKGSVELRDTDGLTNISAHLEGPEVRVEVEGAKRALDLRVIPLTGAPMVESIQLNGAPVEQVTEPPENPKPYWTREPDGVIRVAMRPEHAP